MTKKIKCPFCLETFAIEIYLEEGEVQDMTYDCEVCCHPIDIKAYWDPDAEKFRVTTERSTGFD